MPLPEDGPVMAFPVAMEGACQTPASERQHTVPARNGSGCVRGGRSRMTAEGVAVVEVLGPAGDAGMPRMLTGEEVAGLLRCSRRTVYRLANTGTIPPPVRLGGLARWPRETIQAWIDAGCPKHGKSFSRRNF